VERAATGNALGQLGDPRFHGDEFWSLPADDLLGFVEIPAGSFRMGSTADDASADDDEKDMHDVDLPAYYITRYPVTVAQFRAFVEAQPEYRWAGEGGSQGPWNHPVVRVSWHDAMAYCAWLTACLQERWEALPERLQQALGGMQWQVTLPSEAEWEKAVRGTDGRQYPWGAAADPTRANYSETGIGTTSTVGCFPGGASPYGVEDLSGNVWEWTRSLWGEDVLEPAFTYPYRLDVGRENMAASDDIRRVLRGGAFWDNHQDVRCACRHRGDPRFDDHFVGFRVVVAVRPLELL
jgi:formylglycine-generating enzyme required for sulfatase activity